MSADLKQLAQRRLEALGLTVTFGKYVNEIDVFSSTTIDHRIEEDSEDKDVGFDRHLQSLLHQSWIKQVRGVVIGRHEKASGTTEEKLIAMLRSKRGLRDLPIIANVDFGHTTPLITFPIGGQARINAVAQPRIEIVSH